MLAAKANTFNTAGSILMNRAVINSTNATAMIPRIFFIVTLFMVIGFQIFVEELRILGRVSRRA
jgi:hypothetical protein